MLVLGVFAVSAPTHAQACGYSGCSDTPIYNYYPAVYYPQSPSLPQVAPVYAQLNVQCYPMTLTTSAGNAVTWYASAYGGNNSYYYTWTGTDGLTGYGSTISKIYYTAGYKIASISVTSGGQTASANCDGSVNVYGTASSPYYAPTYPTYPTNYVPSTYYNPLTVTCSPNTSYSSSANGSITWNAYASGGNGSYTYAWSGSDNLSGSGPAISYTYSYPGTKTASVTVYSNGQSITQQCSSGVTVGYTAYQTVGYQPVYGTVNSNSNGLDIGCYSDPATISANQPVTWLVEVTGGAAPYTYSWTGSDGLTGSQSSVVKTYSTAGQKSAIVTVTSADGKTGTRSCTNTLAVRGSGYGSSIAYSGTRTPNTAVNSSVNTSNTSGTSLSAATLFSLQNVPWGWIAIIIILLLFATVLYLVFNKPKI